MSLRILRLTTLAAVAAAVAVAAAPAAPAARSDNVACWKRLMNDWYHGSLNQHVYPISCYQQALDHLPPDVQVYSNARDDIEQARAQALAEERRSKTTITTIQTNPAVVPPKASGTTTSRTTTRDRTTTHDRTTTRDQTTTSATTTHGGAAVPPPKKPPKPPLPPHQTNPPKGPAQKAIRAITPGGAGSFPLPLLILGLLAALLVLAGLGGLAWRRFRTPRSAS